MQQRCGTDLRHFETEDTMVVEDGKRADAACIRIRQRRIASADSDRSARLIMLRAACLSPSDCLVSGAGRKGSSDHGVRISQW